MKFISIGHEMLLKNFYVGFLEQGDKNESKGEKDHLLTPTE